MSIAPTTLDAWSQKFLDAKEDQPDPVDAWETAVLDAPPEGEPEDASAWEQAVLDKPATEADERETAEFEQLRSGLSERRQGLLDRIAGSNAELTARVQDGWDEASDDEKLSRINRSRATVGLQPVEDVAGPAGVGQFLKEDLRFSTVVPYVGVLADGARMLNVLAATTRAELGEATIDDWERLAEFQEQLVRESRGKTIPGQAASILSQSIPFMAEFFTSGGVVPFVKKGGKEAGKAIVKKGMSSAIRKAMKSTVSLGARSAARLPLFSHRVAATAIERMVPAYTARAGDEDGLEIVILKPGEDVATAASNAVIDTYIELFSEGTGGAVAIIGRPIKKGIKKGAEKLTRKKLPVVRQGVKDFLGRAGYHGIIEEIGEERIGEVMREVVTRIGAADLPQQLPTAKGMAAEALAFTVPAVGGAVSSGIVDRHVALLGRDQILTKEGVSVLSAENPTAAAEIASKQQPSRADVQKLTPAMEGSSKGERAKLARLLRKNQKEQEKAAEASREAVQVPTPAPAVPEVEQRRPTLEAQTTKELAQTARKLNTAAPEGAKGIKLGVKKSALIDQIMEAEDVSDARRAESLFLDPDQLATMTEDEIIRLPNSFTRGPRRNLTKVAQERLRLRREGLARAAKTPAVPRETVPIARPIEGPPPLARPISQEQPPPGPPGVLFSDLPEPDANAPVPSEELLDQWHGERELETKRAQADAANFKAAIRGLTKDKKEAAELEAAIHQYIDLKGQEQGQIGKWWGGIGKAKIGAQSAKAVFERSQNLSPPELAIAEQLREMNLKSGQRAVGENVIREARENYTARLYKQKGRRVKGEKLPVFSTTTARAKARKYRSMMEGLAKGEELAVPSVVDALLIARTQVEQAIADRRLLKAGMKAGLISAEQHVMPNGKKWVPLKPPGFSAWVHSGQIKEGKVSGKRAFIGGKGKEGAKPTSGPLFVRAQLYAMPAFGKHLNKVLGTSALMEFPGAKALTRFNSIAKQIILTSAFFHHQAIMRSSMLGSVSPNLVQSWKDGHQAMMNFEPMLQELIYWGGLTYGERADWQDVQTMDMDRITAMVSRVPMAVRTKDALLWFAKKQSDFLFLNMQPSLKIGGALLEYQRLINDHDAELAAGTVKRKDLAKIVGGLMNADFGGLNLARFGRNPTAQHIQHLLLLAPDWTYSNVLSMARAFKGGLEGRVYRKFWRRIAVRGLGTTVLLNLMLAGFDDKTFWERYKQAWKDPKKLRWLSVDVTPVYNALYGKDGKTKYFRLIGHFSDPMKFAVDPVRSAKHKGSVVAKMGLEALTGTDWAGREFTTWSELIGVDRKGFYKTTVPGKHVRGQQKGGKLAGHLVRSAPFSGGHVRWEQMPSFALAQIRGLAPIPANALAEWLEGEIDAFDTHARTLGIATQTTYPEQPR